MTRRSALYVGEVVHRRHRVEAARSRPHALRMRTFHLLADLDELDDLDRDVRGFAVDRVAPVALHASDHLAPVAGLPGGGNLRQRLHALLHHNGVEVPAGRVQLLAWPRFLGHTFNPVSWWFCHDADGQVALVVAEVNSTFGDRRAYLLDDLAGSGRDGGVLRADAPKDLHVSPFLGIADHHYRFSFRPPAQRVAVHLGVDVAGERTLDATQTGQRVELTTASLWRAVASNPLLPLRAVVAIHWHALKVVARRLARFHRRPEPNPNASLLRTARKSVLLPAPAHTHHPTSSRTQTGPTTTEDAA